MAGKKTQGVVDLHSGDLHFMFTDTATGVAQAEGGKVDIIAVTSAERLDAIPDIPTMAESGLPGYEFVAWLAFVVPAETPDEVVGRLAELSNEVIEDPATREFLADLYIQPYPGSPEQLRDLIASDTERWGEMIRAAGIEPQ